MSDDGVALRGNILNERSAQSYVQNLNAAADGEHGSTALASLFDQRRLGCIACGIYRTYFRVRGLTIPGGVDIASTGEHQTGHGIENCRRGALRSEERRVGEEG